MTRKNSSAISPESHRIRGYFFIAAAAFFWAASAALGKVVFNGRLRFAGHSVAALDPLIISQARTTISLLVLAPVLRLLRGPGALRMGGRDVLRCMALGLFGITVSNFFYYFAIAKTTVPTAIILQYTAPLWVLLYMVTRHAQRITTARGVTVGAGAVGAAVAIGAFGTAHVRFNTIGVIAALVAAFGFAFYNIYGHHVLGRLDRWKTIAYALVGAAAFWIVVNPPWRIVAAHYSKEQWIFMIAFALASWLLPFSFYFAGLQHLDATRAIVTSCLEPVFAIAISAIFLGDHLAPLQMAGAGMVLAATVLVQLPARGEPVTEASAVGRVD